MSQDKSNESNNDIPEMNLDSNYQSKPPIVESPSKIQKEMEKTKKEIDKIKTFITKKYNFVQAVSVIPPQALKLVIEEEVGDDIPKEQFEKLSKKVHLSIIVPDDKEKKIPEMKKAIVDQIEKAKQEVWVHVKTPSEIWEMCFDSKFELLSAFAMSYPLYDKGLLGALRVAEIHKSLVLQKFEKYVVSYVLGGSLIRGETEKTSDVDVFVIINDTDVKRMPRRELLDRLRSIIYQYVAEAGAMAGVKNKLEPQIYLLTDFWDAVKDAHPVMFTFIRDGVPIYDRGTFMPWKALLKMGKLKPSPEAIDMFMSMGDGVIPRSKRTLLSDIFTNIFWGVTTPAQAMVMLNGSPPPNAKKELIREFKKQFLDTKMLEKKYIDFLEKVVQTWRDYEHEKIKEISGKEIDDLLKQTEDFLERLKKLREQIEKKYQQNTIEQVYQDVTELLKTMMGKKTQEKYLETFDKEYVKKGKFGRQHLRMLKDIFEVNSKFKRTKMDSHKVDRARRDADILIKDLVEYNQRLDLLSLEKSKMKLKFKSGSAELLSTDEASFFFMNNSVKKITDKIQDSTMEEVSKAIAKQRGKMDVVMNSKVFDLIKKQFGDFEIIL